MAMSDKTTGLILAGGAGLRMGGRDKGLLDWHGKPMAAHVAERLRPQVGRLVVSCNRNKKFYATLADATVADSRRDFQGPLAGLEAAAAQLDSDIVIVTPCDTPLLPLDLVPRLLAAMTASARQQVDIAYAHDGERAQYLCAAIRREILLTITSFLDQGQRAVKQWYAHHRCEPVDFSDRADCFINLNRLQ